MSTCTFTIIILHTVAVHVHGYMHIYKTEGQFGIKYLAGVWHFSLDEKS